MAISAALCCFFAGTRMNSRASAFSQPPGMGAFLHPAAPVQHPGQKELRDGIQYPGTANSDGLRITDRPVLDIIFPHVNFINSADNCPHAGSDVIAFKRRTRRTRNTRYFSPAISDISVLVPISSTRTLPRAHSPRVAVRAAM